MEGTALFNSAARSASLAWLASRIEMIQRGRIGCAPAWVTTNWPKPLDQLGRGVIHEWIGASATTEHSHASSGELWVPPLGLFMHLARLAIEQDSSAAAMVIWIGRTCWPNPCAMTSGELLNRSLFIDPPDRAARVWTIDLCLRSAASAAVIADGSGLNMAHSRRLQLAAEAGAHATGGGALALLARPWHERACLSAAATRWAIRTAPTIDAVGGAGAARQSHNPRWIVQLLRCKGVRPVPAQPEARAWAVEDRGDEGGVGPSADVVHRPGEAAIEPPRRQRLSA